MNDPTAEPQNQQIDPEVLEHLKAMGIAYVPPSTSRPATSVRPYRVSPWLENGTQYVPPAPVLRRSPDPDPGFEAPPSAMPRDLYFDIPSTLPPQSKVPEFQAPAWWEHVQRQTPTVVHPRAYSPLPRQP